MPRTITYYFALISPFTYLGHDRLLRMAARHGAAVDHRPIDIMTVFRETDALPPAKRHPSTLAYRALDLRRWARRLGLPMTARPRHWPVPVGPASAMVMAAGDSGADMGPLAGACLRAVWAEDRDISDPATLQAIAADQGLDAIALLARAEDPVYAERLAANTQAALDAGVFGSPSYVLDGELFWGQDRLDLLEEALAGR